MTRIGGTRPDGLPAGHADTHPLPQHGKDDPAFGKAGQRGDGFGLQSHFGNSDFGDSLPDEREHAFLQKMKRAIGEPDTATDSAREPRVIAIATTATPAPFSPFAVHDATATAGPGDAAAMRANALGDRIEHAIRAELRGNPQAAVTLTLDLPGDETGLAGITITMGRDSIDVVLRHGGIGDAAGIVQAAQLLAERLQTRFVRRTVQILELETSQAQPSRSLDELSALLARRGDQT